MTKNLTTKKSKKIQPVTEVEAVLSLPSADDNLEGIPFLGETRRAALALAGLRTRQDLMRATVEQIGGVKGVGMVNAARVKDYLQSQTENLSSPPTAIDPELADTNQQVQDIFQKLEDASSLLKEHLPAKSRAKNLGRQLAKLDNVAAELAEGPDTLSAAQLEKAVKTLDKIAALLTSAANLEKLTPKKQAVLIEELRDRRKRLEKTLAY
jgi:hypothetical protein